MLGLLSIVGFFHARNALLGDHCVVHYWRGVISANDAVGLLLHLQRRLPGLPDVFGWHVLRAIPSLTHQISARAHKTLGAR